MKASEPKASSQPLKLGAPFAGHRPDRRHPGCGGGAFYYSVADYDSANIVLSAPLSVLGLAPGQSFDFSVRAYDNYFSGLTTDTIGPMTYTVDTPKFTLLNGAVPVTDLTVAQNSTMPLFMQSTGSAAPSTQTGLLLLFDDAASLEARAVIATL